MVRSWVHPEKSSICPNCRCREFRLTISIYRSSSSASPFGGNGTISVRYRKAHQSLFALGGTCTPNGGQISWPHTDLFTAARHERSILNGWKCFLEISEGAQTVTRQEYPQFSIPVLSDTIVAIASHIFVVWSVLDYHHSKEEVSTWNNDYGETRAISLKSRR